MAQLHDAIRIEADAVVLDRQLQRGHVAIAIGDHAPMRLLFTSSPAVGHLMPILPVAIAARERRRPRRVRCDLQPLPRTPCAKPTTPPHGTAKMWRLS